MMIITIHIQSFVEPAKTVCGYKWRAPYVRRGEKVELCPLCKDLIEKARM